MNHLNRFEQGIENILSRFDLKLSRPEVLNFPEQKMVGYYRACDLRSSYPARLIIERSWCAASPNLAILDFRIEQNREEMLFNYCQIDLTCRGLIFLGLNFFDFEKLRNNVPDPSLVQLMKKNKRTFEGEDFQTGQTKTIEISEDGSYKEVSPLYLNTVRNMMLKDVLYEPIYRHDKKKFDEEVSATKSRGDSLLENLAVYFCKFGQDLGFSF